MWAGREHAYDDAPEPTEYDLAAVARSTPADTAASSLVPFSSAAGQYASYSWKNVVGTLWVGPVTLPGIELHDQKLGALCELHPRGVSTVDLVLPGRFKLPSAEVRERLVRFTQKYAQRVVASAVVLPGDGFWASAVRGAVTANSLLSRTEIKQQVFATSRQAADWLPPVHLQRTGIVVEGEELAAFLASVERRAQIAV